MAGGSQGGFLLDSFSVEFLGTQQEIITPISVLIPSKFINTTGRVAETQLYNQLESDSFTG
jgi:hypothetical protein